MRTPKAIGHCDAEAFYVSAERVRNQFLVGKPVGVLGNQGACVIAKSKEMKASGVATGMPIWEALALCPDGIYVKRDFRWYEVLSRLMLGCVRELFARVEYYSIDEFFFEAVPLPGLDLQGTAEAVRDRIMDVVGIPMRVGIARTRTLAKLISDSAGSRGARAILDDRSTDALLASQPVTEITGIAGRRERRLAPWNIQTCFDFIQADRRLIRQLLTVSGEALWWELRGEPVLPLHPSRPLHKMLSRGGSFGEPTSSPVVLWAWLVRNLERLIEELEYHEICAGKLTIWVGYKHGESRTASTTLAAPSQRFDVLLDAARPCLRRAWIPRASANRMHLIADDLTNRNRVQRGLFEPPSTRAEAVAQLKREINRRHGRFILRSGATLPLPEIYRDPANGYDICDIRGKSCF
jgi:nucleotidyltransferase/DNA polymerase involved in DNA repair